ncbi:hypothetical protein ACFTAO_15660 [Paenibacillus rhizoplanae]
MGEEGEYFYKRLFFRSNKNYQSLCMAPWVYIEKERQLLEAKKAGGNEQRHRTVMVSSSFFYEYKTLSANIFIGKGNGRVGIG